MASETTLRFGCTGSTVVELAKFLVGPSDSLGFGEASFPRPHDCGSVGGVIRTGAAGAKRKVLVPHGLISLELFWRLRPAILFKLVVDSQGGWISPQANVYRVAVS